MLLRGVPTRDISMVLIFFSPSVAFFIARLGSSATVSLVFFAKRLVSRVLDLGRIPLASCSAFMKQCERLRSRHRTAAAASLWLQAVIWLQEPVLSPVSRGTGGAWYYSRRRGRDPENRDEIRCPSSGKGQQYWISCPTISATKLWFLKLHVRGVLPSWRPEGDWARTHRRERPEARLRPGETWRGLVKWPPTLSSWIQPAQQTCPAEQREHH